ncbi:helix-turn-helix transcriptional regulator [Mucilaginibacter sp. 10I4]|uniref:helix-turn-helix transcriptional regulator n=1 Tax=Mucilaginibacter sp. 10I4 TaxID=3048580 RepID=UPI002B22BF02|nr:helix-turn-helix transcriptional regulator [Mucilaginibacter sp. 10I4]MEB0261814.1 helix-turn-helix transcriptional regulator [Mucilaginibacter sp. 10I4]
MAEPRLNRLSIVLDELKLDQLDLAVILEVSKDTVSRWCRNANQPKLSDIYNIAKIFRIDIRRLIEPTDWKDETGNTVLEDYLEKKKADKIVANKITQKSRKNKK